MSRPLSAQHNKTSFGEQYFRRNLEMIPKVSNYNIDGSGRDGYINYNNGGNKKPSFELGPFKFSNKVSTMNMNTSKNYNVIPKLSRYKSDGFGRDQYIVQDCGGFYNPGGGSNLQHSFHKTLRGYGQKITKVIPNDFSMLSKCHILEQYKPVIKEKSKKQRILSARLSQPKYMSNKYVNIY